MRWKHPEAAQPCGITPCNFPSRISMRPSIDKEVTTREVVIAQLP